MPTFSFDPEKHIYTLDGKAIPSVTQVLPYNYGNNAEYARQRGIYVHTMIELYNQGNLNEESLDKSLQPYLDAYQKFLSEGKLQGITDIKSGSPHPCTALQLAGYKLLVDAILGVESIPLPAYELKLYHHVYHYAGTIDIVAPGHQIQTLYLYDNGTYKLEDYTKDYRKNKNIFLSFLIAYQWRQEKGLL